MFLEKEVYNQIIMGHVSHRKSHSVHLCIKISEKDRRETSAQLQSSVVPTPSAAEAGTAASHRVGTRFHFLGNRTWILFTSATPQMEMLLFPVPPASQGLQEGQFEGRG